MNWNEASIFTWSDSSSFTWDVLTLDKYEFIAKQKMVPFNFLLMFKKNSVVSAQNSLRKFPRKKHPFPEYR